MWPEIAAADKDCADFTYQQEAQAYFESIGGSNSYNADNLDADSDGAACDLLPSAPATRTSNNATRTTANSVRSDGGGFGWFWPVAGLGAAGAGLWYHANEVRGPQNWRAPRTPCAVYDPRRMPYADYLRTPEWFAIRQMALERDGKKCTRCGSTHRLQAHHVTYRRRGHEKVKDLTTLCSDCHDKHHRR
jgi:hypothetical protein